MADFRISGIKVEEYGTNNLKWNTDLKIGPLGPNQVLIELKAASVNPADVQMALGVFPIPKTLPYVPGLEGAGIVTKCGQNVTSVKVGNRVFACIPGDNGTYATHTIAEESEVYPLDGKLSFQEGAAIALSYFTAIRALNIRSQPVPGSTILIHGASGGVGTAAVQVAKHLLGLKVIGTAGDTEGCQFIKDLGCDVALNHNDSNYWDKLKSLVGSGVDIILENKATKNLENDLKVIKPMGTILVVGAPGDCKFSGGDLLVTEASIVAVLMFHTTKEEGEKVRKIVVNGIKDGWLKPVVGETYDLKDAMKAHEASMSSAGKRGKIVLNI